MSDSEPLGGSSTVPDTLALLRRDAILEAVGFAAERLLRSASWEETIHEVLERLGGATGVSRVYVFHNRWRANGTLVADEIFEWCTPDVPSTLELDWNQDLPYLPEYEHYVTALSAGDTLTFRRATAPPLDLEDLEAEGILSTVFAPIFTADAWWGYLGFDDCVVEREWSKSELDALKVAGATLGAAIERDATNTERKSAQEEVARAQELYRTLVENVPAITYREVPEGDHGKTIYVSPQIESILGVTTEEWMQPGEGVDPWVRMLHPDDRERVLREYQEWMNGGPDIGDYRMIRPDGRMVWIRDRGTPVRDKNGTLIMDQGFMFDVTDQKQAEEQVERSLAQERQISEDLRRLNEMKDTFLTAVSHDFRTPLSAVMGLALTMARDEVHLSEEENRDFARRIAANAGKLERLVADLLDLDRLSRGTVDLETKPRDIGALVAEVVSEWNATSASGSSPVPVEVEVESEAIVLPVDRAKVERILENLLANASRHAAGTKVWVKVLAQDHGALIIIEDEGPGVPDELKEAVFEAFRQGPVSSATPGIGVGLSLVAKFAELHGGRAWVQDRPGGGASFRVLLPDSNL